MNWGLRIAKSAKKNILSFPKKDYEIDVKNKSIFIGDVRRRTSTTY